MNELFDSQGDWLPRDIAVRFFDPMIDILESPELHNDAVDAVAARLPNFAHIESRTSDDKDGIYKPSALIFETNDYSFICGNQGVLSVPLKSSTSTGRKKLEQDMFPQALSLYSVLVDFCTQQNVNRSSLAFFEILGRVKPLRTDALELPIGTLILKNPLVMKDRVIGLGNTLFHYNMKLDDGLQLFMRASVVIEDQLDESRVEIFVSSKVPGSINGPGLISGELTKAVDNLQLLYKELLLPVDMEEKE